MSLGYGMVIGHGGWWGTGGPSSSAGKSAVQLLQESKSRYVKSDRVLVSHQEPSRPERLHISANPNIFLSAPAHTLHPHSHHTPGRTHVPVISSQPPPVPPRSNNVTPLTAVALALHTSPSSCGISIPPPLPSRSPRGPPRPRAKTRPVGDAFPRGGDLRRSLSHGPADRSNDVQMKLRQLLNTDSKESLALNGPSEEPKDEETITLNGTFRAEVISVCSHKSLPNLNKSFESSESQIEPQRRPSCPGAISRSSVPKPPPRPPRRSLGECPPKIPVRPPPRPPPPKLPIKNYMQNGISVNGISAVNGSSALQSENKYIRKSTSSSSAEDSCTDVVASPTEGTRRRPILRSKSDVTHERPLGGRWEDLESRRSSYCSNELEDFFNSMGLDSSTLRLVESPQIDGSTPIYFEERSSEESGHHARRESDDSEEIKSSALQQIGAKSLGRRLTGEPSIVEKNARVIKWLFNCQKAYSSAIPRSLSSGS